MTNTRARTLPTIALGLALGALASCNTGRIPNTDVADTRENRELVDLCERYRHAVEQRDVQALLALAAPGYYEDGGTPDGNDDYGFEGLRQLLSAWTHEVKEIRYEMRYRRVTFERDGDRALVDYTYTGSFVLRRTPLELPEGVPPPRSSVLNVDPARPMNRANAEDDVWYRRVADNRLELEKHQGQWRIVAGM